MPDMLRMSAPENRYRISATVDSKSCNRSFHEWLFDKTTAAELKDYTVSGALSIF